MSIHRKYATNADRQAAYRTRCSASTPPKQAIPAVVGTRRWAVLLKQAQGLLEGVSVEMAQYWDERSEAWQYSERIESLEEVVAQLQEVIEA